MDVTWYPGWVNGSTLAVTHPRAIQAFYARLAVQNPNYKQPVTQPLEGLDPEPHIPPYSDIAGTKAPIISTEEVNPDSDIHPTGAYEVVVTPTHGVCLDPHGHTLGTLPLDHIQSLAVAHASTPCHNEFARDLAHALASHPPQPHQGHHIRRDEHPPFIPPDDLHSLVEALSLTTEWLPHGLARHFVLPRFTSPHPCMQSFGCLPDPWSLRWTRLPGLVIPNPTHPAPRDALAWAIASALVPSIPTLNLVLVRAAGPTHATTALTRHPLVQQIGFLPLQGRRYRLLLVSNSLGFRAFAHPPSLKDLRGKVQGFTLPHQPPRGHTPVSKFPTVSRRPQMSQKLTRMSNPLPLLPHLSTILPHTAESSPCGLMPATSFILMAAKRIHISQQGCMFLPRGRRLPSSALDMPHP